MHQGKQMKVMRSVVVVLAVALLAVPDLAPAAPPPFDSAESSPLAQGSLAQLRGIDDLKSWFNANKGHPRLIFLVSPT